MQQNQWENKTDAESNTGGDGFNEALRGFLQKGLPDTTEERELRACSERVLSQQEDSELQRFLGAFKNATEEQCEYQ